LFKIEPTRSADVLLEVLERNSTACLGFAIIIPAYRRYIANRQRRAVLPGALIRDVKFLTRCRPPGAVFGEQLREGLRDCPSSISARR